MEDQLWDPKDTLDMGFVLVRAVVGENDAIADFTVVFGILFSRKSVAMSTIASFSPTTAPTSVNPISSVSY